MFYTLLTGATGLLGRYLLCDLLRGGHQVVVLVRPSRRSTAQQRIEDVLLHWENIHQQALPRPVVLCGDIIQTNLGLDAQDLSWLTKNCGQVIHSAASLAFVEDPESGEPARSNIGGVKHVLQLCQRLNNPHLVHISTAYVCGRTEGSFSEDQLDIGQQFANPYESSKAEAERMVRTADGLSGFTVMRPSIITGDSQTGFASTYHGFYAPLRVLQAILSQGGAGEQLSAINYLSALGLDGSERKNFVPVDWVSDAAVKILARQKKSNQTYALVSPAPMRVADLQDAFFESVTRFLGEASANAGKPKASNGIFANLGNEGIEQEFRNHFKVYESYWRDDCTFESTNTQELLTDTPCPVMDRDLAVRMSDAALEANFGFPTPPPVKIGFWAADWLKHNSAGWSSLGESSESVVLNSVGAGGGVWTLTPHSAGIHVSPGQNEVNGRLTLSTSTLQQIAGGEIDLAAALDQGLAFSSCNEAAERAKRCFSGLRSSSLSQSASF